ncbi:MAG: hypothetical protein ACRDZZ_09015, partial [Ilumatobacteraceae bacterium]
MRRTRHPARRHLAAIGAVALTFAVVGCRDDGNDLFGAGAVAGAVGDADSAGETATGDTQPPTTEPTPGPRPPDDTQPAENTQPPTTEPTTDTEPPDDTQPPTATQPPVASSTLAFCNSMVTADATFAQGPDVDFASAPPEQIDAAIAQLAATLDPLLAEALATAPTDIAADVEATIGFIRGSLESGGDIASNAEFRVADERVDQYVAASCGYDSINVSAAEFSFANLPSTLPAGRTTFVFTNDGAEIHEMVVFRVNDGVT